MAGKIDGAGDSETTCSIDDDDFNKEKFHEGPAGKEDDVEAFLRTLNPEHETCPPSIVTKLIHERKIGCLTALLERKTSHNKIDFNLVATHDWYNWAFECHDAPPLSQAARREAFPEAVELFLRHGASPNSPIRDRPYFNSRRQQDMLPLDYALEDVLDIIHYMDHRCESYNPPGEQEEFYLKWPLSDMIIWLVEWTTQHFGTWRSLKLLGPATSRGHLEKRIFEHARDGHVAELFYLLLTVPDRVLSPTFFRCATWGKELDLDRHFAKLSLRDFLAARLAHFTALDMQRPKGDFDDIQEEISYLTTSLLLLEVFRRAGPQLSSLVSTLEKDKEKLFEKDYYCRSLENPLVAREVKAVLKRAGFPLKSLNYTIICFPNKWYCGATHPPLESGEIQLNDRGQDEKYPELQFLNLPGYICRSEVLDSDFSRAIEMLCHHPYLKEYWSPQMSPFKLLLIFCHPDLVEKMQSMLPFELKSVNPAKVIDPTYLAELCSVYITEGRIVEFTAALMAVRVFLRLELPLRPQQLSSHNVNVTDDSIASTVYEYLLVALKRVLDEEISLTGENENSDSVKIFKEKKLKVTSAFLLTEIFEKSAEHIYWFLHSTTYKEQKDLKMIAKDFATLLKDLGYKLKAKDICVDDLECFSRVNKTGSEANSLSSIEPHRHTAASFVKGKDEDAILKSKNTVMMSTTTLESLSTSLHPASCISRFSARSYHSFSVLRYEGSKKVDQMVKRVETEKWLKQPIIRKSWRILAMTKRIMRQL